MSRVRKSVALVAIGASLFAASVARADEPETGRALAAPAASAGASAGGPEFSLDLDAMTLLPLVVGAVGGFEVPGHVVIRVGGGVVPAAYVDAINDVCTGWGVYDEGTAQVASLLLNDAVLFEVGLGLRPAGSPGIELDVSYAMLWTHRALDMAQLSGSAALGGPAGLDVVIDAIHGELAWQGEPIEHVYFRIAIGWAHAFDRHVTIGGAGDEATQRAMGEVASGLADSLSRHAFGPTVGAALGFRI